MQIRPLTTACLLLVIIAACGRFCVAADEPVEAMRASTVVPETLPDYLGPRGPSDGTVLDLGPQIQRPLDGDLWSWQVFPGTLIYKTYLAGEKEPRMAAEWYHRRGGGWVWDITLGSRIGVLRYGTANPYWPEGLQLDVEGAAFPRMTADDQRGMIATDFRGGVPLTYRLGPLETKFGYSHISAHAGDEFLLTNPSFVRLNYVRDSLVAGVALRPTPDVRLYAETGWAFHTDDGAEPWEFQFGVEYSSMEPSSRSGSPFFAINGHLREENDFGGVLTIQTGWQWRNTYGGLFRFGLHYQTGACPQYEFYSQHEDNLGMGIWYDF